MNTEEIISIGNKKIAKFIGLTHKSPMFSDKSFCPGYYTDKNKLVAMMDYHFKYHSSWEWLMPVVDEIKKLNIDKNILSSVGLKINNLTIFDEIFVVWEAVVECIDWLKSIFGSEKIDGSKISSLVTIK
jgi:hypothetical protein